LAHACARRAEVPQDDATFRALGHRLSMDTRFLGAGYGHPNRYGEDAAAEAMKVAGIVLDPTYTAKAFAGALWHLRSQRSRRVLYWHTLSSAPMEPLLEDAPAESELDPRLRRLVLARA
jgi:hypothetical protein